VTVALRPAEIPLAGVTLPEARSGAPLDLGGLGRTLVTLIRHRY